MKRRSINRYSGFILFMLLLITLSVCADQEDNIAKGKPYTITPEAGYPYSKDAGDAVQLTDGLRATAQWLWADKKSVGWHWESPIIITIDLGNVLPISGANYSTAFGRAGVTAPFAIYILLSDDGKDFYLLGDLISASAANGCPDPRGYKTHEYKTKDLPGRGRYIRLVVVPAGIFTMCDEVEVFAGTDDQKDLPRGEPIRDITQMIKDRKLSAVVQGRMAADLSNLETRRNYPRRDDLRREMIAFPAVEKIDWRAGLPYNDLHRKIWASHAAWARKEFPSSPHILLWTQNRWKEIQPFDLPKESQLKDVELDVKMINGEYRSAVLNITNTSDTSQWVEFDCKLPEGFPADTVIMRDAVYVENQARWIRAMPLPLARRVGDTWQMDVPSGVTKQIWITFHPQKVKPGSYTGEIHVSCKDLKIDQTVPVKLKMYPLTIPDKPTLATLTWEYCHDGGYIQYDGVWKAAIPLMKEYLINVPFMTGAGIPWPNPKQFDKDGTITEKLNWSRLDKWISAWGQDAKYFFLFIGEPRGFMIPECRLSIETGMGKKIVHQVIGQLVERFKLQGIPADRIVILSHDETHSNDEDRRIIAWAKEIHAANPDIRIFSDPIYSDPTEAVPESFEAVDIVCPNRTDYDAPYGGVDKPEFAAFYEKIRKSGKLLMVHACGVANSEADPYGYFLQQGWFVFEHGMVGNSYWALTDVRHLPFGKVGSWNDFAGRPTFSIMYWDESGVIPSRQMEAIREAAEDYECLLMLKEAIAKASPAAAARAQKVLDRAVEHVRKSDSLDAADQSRIQVLEEVVKLTQHK